MNKLMVVKKSIVGGVEEITGGDLTHGERVVVAGGVGAVVGGSIDLGIGALLTGVKAAAFVAVGKVAIVGGSVVCVGALGKAFVRGAREQWHHEMLKSRVL